MGFLKTLTSGILLMSSTVSCASYVNEVHYFRSHTEDKDHVPNNYYKVVVDGYTFGSSARYLAGYFDETAVDSYFSEFSQPANGKFPQSLSSEKSSEGNSEDNQSTLKKQPSGESIEPINPALKGRRLILILSSNSDEVATQIGGLAESQKLGGALTRVFNKDKLLSAHKSRQDAKLLTSDQQDLAAKGQSWISDLDSTKVTQTTTKGNVLQYLNAISTTLGNTAPFKDFEDATGWLNRNRSRLLQE